MLLSMLISQLSYMIVAPFLPPNFKEKGVDEDMIGCIFAIYPVASIVISLTMAKYSNVVSEGAAFGIGLALMGSCFICFGLLDMI